MALVSVLFIFWVFSFILCFHIYAENGISETLWSVLFAIVPVINTVMVIVLIYYFGCGIDEFFTEIKKKSNERKRK